MMGLIDDLTTNNICNNSKAESFTQRYPYENCIKLQKETFNEFLNFMSIKPLLVILLDKQINIYTKNCVSD